MRNLFIFILTILIISSCNSENKSTETNSENKKNNNHNLSDRKYKLESGIINYKMDMMGLETKMSVYFKEYGRIEASYTETEMMGERTVIRTLQKDNYYYTFTPAKNTGTKFQMSGNEILDEAAMHKMNEADILKQGGKKIGKEKILGKECTVYQLIQDDVDTKVWIWNSMFLKTIASQNGMEMKMEAYEIKETSNFPAGIFDVPKNIKFSNPAENIEPEGDFENQEAEG